MDAIFTKIVVELPDAVARLSRELGLTFSLTIESHEKLEAKFKVSGKTSTGRKVEDRYKLQYNPEHNIYNFYLYQFSLDGSAFLAKVAPDREGIALFILEKSYQDELPQTLGGSQ